MSRAAFFACLFVAAASAVALVLWAAGPWEPAAEAGPPTPGMSLNGPASMHVGQTVELSVSAAPAPAAQVAGYNTEIFLPSGLSWVQRPACLTEVLGRTGGGQNPQLCTRATGPQGQARHVTGTSITPPLPPFDAPLTTLVEIDVRCNEAGSYKIDLTAAGAGASFGAVYFGTDLLPIDVAAISQDLDVDGDTTPEFTQVADSLNMTCIEATVTSTVPPSTATFTPTHTPTHVPTPTETPEPVDTDGDKLSDPLEALLRQCPASDDADSDNDGLRDGLEALIGTNICIADSDKDYLSDGLELYIASVRPPLPQIGRCPHPLDRDTDGDGWGDGVELLRHTNLCGRNSHP